MLYYQDRQRKIITREETNELTKNVKACDKFEKLCICCPAGRYITNVCVCVCAAMNMQT